jgi:ABC-type transport system involved in multi-copper enzyme maturation permease subunit
MRGITRETLAQMIDRRGTLIALPLMLSGVIAVCTGDWRQLHVSFGNSAGGVDPAGVAEVALHFLSTYMNLLVGLVVILAAGIFPAMLDPDRTWYFFGRTLSRGKIVLEKLFAVVIVYLCLLFATVIPAVATGMLRYEVFDVRIGEIVLIHLFNGGVWLVLISSFGLLWRSTTKAVLAGLVVWVMQLILVNRSSILEELDLALIAPLLNTLYLVLPKTTELSGAADLIAAGRTTDLVVPVFTTLLFTSLLLYCALVAVRRRDL